MAEFAVVSELTSSGLLQLNDLEKVVATLRRGGLCVLPTETGHMLAALATSVTAVESAFFAKSRDFAVPMHVACSSLEMIERISRLNVTALRLLGRLTPGPITVIVPQRDVLPDRLVTLNGTVGVRVPDNAATIQVINALGEPLTATSLNEAGRPPVAPTPDGLRTLRWSEREVVYIVPALGPLPYSQPSTLVRVTGPELEVLRPGPISEAFIRSVANSPAYLEYSEAT